MDTEQIVQTLKKSAGTPAGKIALVAVGGIALYRVWSSRRVSSPGTGAAGRSPGIPVVSSAGVTGGASGSSGNSISDQIALLQAQADVQLKANAEALKQAEASRVLSAENDISLKSKLAEAQRAIDEASAKFWFSDLSGNYSTPIMKTEASVSQRGRTPATVSNNIGPTKFDLFFNAQQAPIIAERNAQNAQQYTLFQQQQTLQREQFEAQQRAQDRANNPFLNLGTMLKTGLSLFSLGRSTPAPAPAATPSIVVPPSGDWLGTGGSGIPGISMNLPGASDLRRDGVIRVA